MANVDTPARNRGEVTTLFCRYSFCRPNQSVTV